MSEALESALKYRQWLESLRKHQNQVDSVEELHTVRKKDGSVLFALLRASIQPPDAPALPPVVLLRGHFVSVLVCLTAEETGARFLLLVSQRRVADGSWFLEHPSGMCDSESDPAAVALWELEEETGLKADPSELIGLNDAPLYSSPGLLDEGGWFFALRRTLPASVIAALEGRVAGDPRESSEYIRLRVLPYAEGKRAIRNGMGLLNCCLFEEWEAGE